MNAAREYSVLANREMHGPFTADELRRTWFDGVFGRDTQCRGPDGHWTTIEKALADRSLKIRPLEELLADAQRAFRCHQGGQEPSILDMWPAQELVCVISGNRAKMSWQSIWGSAGGQLFGARMIALRNDSIWCRISGFELPYPPFDEYNLVWVRDVTRAVAERLGLISSSDTLAADLRDWKVDELQLKRRWRERLDAK